MAKQAPARKAVIGADRRSSRRLFNENALFASLLRDQRQPRPTESAGSRGRHGWPFSSPRCTRLCWRRTALHSSVLPAPASPRFPFRRCSEISCSSAHHADRQPATAPLRRAAARRRKISLSSWPSIFSTICSPLSGAIGPLSISRPSRSTVRCRRSPSAHGYDAK